MAKYGKKVVKDICALIKKDTYTVSEICEMCCISDRCYYTWLEEKAEFADSIAQARDQARQIRIREAKRSLMKKIVGYDATETKTVYVNVKDDDGKSKPKIKEQTMTIKHYQPDTTAIMFALTNDDPENYKNRQNSELTGKDGKDLFAKLTDEEVDQRIAELEKKIGK